jgi:alpha,alpha-trehalose phosphorylase
MIHGEHLNPPRYVYPQDEWKAVEKRFHPDFLEWAETIFSLGNGYMGMRGNFEEGVPAFERGTFVNGFHETWPIVYGENAHGFAKTGQTMVSVPDTKIMRLYIDDEPFYLPTANLLAFERVLDMREGTLRREVIWETPVGKKVSIRSCRLISFEHRHLAALSYEVTVLNAAAPVVICSRMVKEETANRGEQDPRQARTFDGRVLERMAGDVDGMRIVNGYVTVNSRMSLSCGMDHRIETECAYSVTEECEDDLCETVFCVDAAAGKPIRIIKYITYHTSRREQPVELCRRAHRTLNRAVESGLEGILKEQRTFLDDFWDRSDVRVTLDDEEAPFSTIELQQAIRFNLFQILQAAGRAEGVGIPAKGLTGRAYEGHYFWDTEIYVLPFLLYTQPRIAKNLLHFRYRMLDKARDRARELSQRGVLFPWRTISGEEASAYYAAGTAQYHINADIMYALKKYVDVTGDDRFLEEYGAEMLVETARLWADLGFFSEAEGGRFCIHGVTGPDEYNTLVNNNTFTNLMAEENLRYAARTIERLKSEMPALYSELVDRTGLDPAEVEFWKKAADNMYVPYDEDAGIHPQDDSFMEKEPWDFENTPPDKYPLLLHFHPLVIYRFQVIKQVDVVLAMFLLGHRFSDEEKKRNFDYYDARTTGDSSLSVGIQSIIACEIGYMRKATEYARYAILMDLHDVAGNVRDGCHIASMGATWMVMVYGFGGMRDYNGVLSFKPKLPHRVERLSFPLTVRGNRLQVDIGRENVTYTLSEGDERSIRHWEEKVDLSRDRPIRSLPLVP